MGVNKKHTLFMGIKPTYTYTWVSYTPRYDGMSTKLLEQTSLPFADHGSKLNLDWQGCECDNIEGGRSNITFKERLGKTEDWRE